MEHLEYICDNYIDVTYATFVRNVGKDNLALLEKSLGYDKNLRLKDDYAVQFRRSSVNKTFVYYLRWSAIEYVFIPKGFTFQPA